MTGTLMLISRPCDDLIPFENPCKLPNLLRNLRGHTGKLCFVSCRNPGLKPDCRSDGMKICIISDM